MLKYKFYRPKVIGEHREYKRQHELKYRDNYRNTNGSCKERDNNILDQQKQNTIEKQKEYKAGNLKINI